jgi:hypothetical protein
MRGSLFDVTVAVPDLYLLVLVEVREFRGVFVGKEEEVGTGALCDSH